MLLDVIILKISICKKLMKNTTIIYFIQKYKRNAPAEDVLVGQWDSKYNSIMYFY